MDKYRFTGHNNPKCPTCHKYIVPPPGPPVIYYHGGAKLQEFRLCHKCFKDIQYLASTGVTETSIIRMLPQLAEILPLDHKISGFWFATVPEQGLTFVVEVKDE